jgi:hypothetical protein
LHCFTGRQSKSQRVQYSTWTMPRGRSDCIASRIFIVLLIPRLLIYSNQSRLVIRMSWEHTLIQNDRPVLACWCAYCTYFVPSGDRPFGRLRCKGSKDFLNEACHQVPATTVTTQPIPVRTPPVSKAVHDVFVDLEQEFPMVNLPQTFVKRRVGHYHISPVMVIETTRHQARLSSSLSLQTSPSCSVLRNQRVLDRTSVV